MKKILSLFLIFTTVFSFSSCLRFEKTEEEYTEEYVNKLLRAIEDKDKEAVKALFSKNTINEHEDFDEDVESLFDLFYDLWSSSCRMNWSGFGSIKKDLRVLVIEDAYYVETISDDSSEEYIFAFVLCAKDKKEPDNVGFIALNVILLDDKPKGEVYRAANRDGSGIMIGTGTENDSLDSAESDE